MQKKTLNEEISRIKKMMKIVSEQSVSEENLDELIHLDMGDDHKDIPHDENIPSVHDNFDDFDTHVHPEEMQDPNEFNLDMDDEFGDEKHHDVDEDLDEQNTMDYYNDPGLESYYYDRPKNTPSAPSAAPKQVGEPIVPYEKTQPTAPTSQINPDDVAKSTANIARMQKNANTLNYYRKYGHQSYDSFKTAMNAGYAPYTSPELKQQAIKGGYFPFVNMAEKRADDAKKASQNPSLRRPIQPVKRPVPPVNKRPTPPPMNKPTPPNNQGGLSSNKSITI